MLGGLVAAMLCSVSLAVAADLPVKERRVAEPAQARPDCPCVLEYPRHDYWVYRLSQWDGEYSNEVGHYAGAAPPPPPVPPEEWLNRPYRYWYR